MSNIRSIHDPVFQNHPSVVNIKQRAFKNTNENEDGKIIKN